MILQIFADARPVGPLADLYSLGCVLYTLLAGRPPLIADSFVEMLRKQVGQNHQDRPRS